MSPFLHLLFSEIARVRASLFQINGVRKEPLQLPEPDGETVTLNEKVYVPVKEHPDVSRTLLFFMGSNLSADYEAELVVISRSLRHASSWVAVGKYRSREGFIKRPFAFDFEGIHRWSYLKRLRSET